MSNKRRSENLSVQRSNTKYLQYNSFNVHYKLSKEETSSSSKKGTNIFAQKVERRGHRTPQKASYSEESGPLLIGRRAEVGFRFSCMRRTELMSIVCSNPATSFKEEVVQAKEAMRNKDWTSKARDCISTELSRFINMSNGVSVQCNAESPSIYRYFLGKGNNSSVVKNCFNSRWWWTRAEDEPSCNLVWTQFIHKNYLKLIPTVSSKPQETIGVNEQSVECNVLFESSDRITRPVDITALGYDQITKSEHFTAIHASQTLNPREIKVHNKLENNITLADKKFLYLNIKNYYLRKNLNAFEYIPLTFHVQNDQDPEFQNFLKEFDRKKGLWIVKPGENTNRGNGICVCNSIDQIMTELQNNPFPLTGQHTFIIQEYINPPFLIHRRKFDIRCFVLLTSVNGILQGYFYQEGYLRTASKEYNPYNLANKLIHLTNDAVQKKSDQYGKYENGNKLSYSDFQRYLDNKKVFVNFNTDILPVIKNIVRDTIQAVSSKIDSSMRMHTFEVFGYDFMLDKDLKPWLIEVNTNPCLELSSPILARIIPAMIENTFKIAVDPLFPEPLCTPKRAPTSLYAESLHENRFELIFHELVDN